MIKQRLIILLKLHLESRSECPTPFFLPALCYRLMEPPRKARCPYGGILRTEKGARIELHDPFGFFGQSSSLGIRA